MQLSGVGKEGAFGRHTCRRTNITNNCANQYDHSFIKSNLCEVNFSLWFCWWAADSVVSVGKHNTWCNSLYIIRHCNTTTAYGLKMQMCLWAVSTPLTAPLEKKTVWNVILQKVHDLVHLCYYIIHNILFVICMMHVWKDKRLKVHCFMILWCLVFTVFIMALRSQWN